MMALTFIPNRSVTLVTSDFRVLTATRDNPNWAKIEEAIKANDEKALIKAISIKESIKEFGDSVVGSGDIKIEGTKVFYRGEPLFGQDIDRMISYLTGGFPKESMVLFLEAKLRNKFPESVNALYNFLENKGMPITDNGTILGYKGVTSDYNSINTGSEPLISGIRNEDGTIRNRIGDTVWMDRKYVCADNSSACAGGLHIGSRNYATNWAGDGRVMVAEFSPEHVVSVPTCEHEKIRVYKYKVVGELKGDFLNDTYNNDYVRPDNVPDPDQIELSAYEGSDEVAEAITKAKTVIDENKITAKTLYAKGFGFGFIDGKGHNKRRFFESERGQKFRRWSAEYISGYLDGYLDGRRGIEKNKFNL